MRVREIGIVLRNMFLGGNVESLLALSEPQQAAYYVGECRFLYNAAFPRTDFCRKPSGKCLRPSRFL